MALPVLEDVFRVALNWEHAGQHAVNVMHIQSISGGSNANDAFTLLDDQLASNMWSSIVADAHITSVDILPLDGVTPTQVFPTTDDAWWSGQSGGDAVINAPVLVSFRTEVRGPRGRGRVFLPFTSEAHIDDGFLASDVQEPMQEAWQQFVDDVFAEDWQLIVASYTHSTISVVGNVIVELPLATQRRRQDRLRS